MSFVRKVFHIFFTTCITFLAKIYQDACVYFMKGGHSCKGHHFCVVKKLRICLIKWRQKVAEEIHLYLTLDVLVFLIWTNDKYKAQMLSNVSGRKLFGIIFLEHLISEEKKKNFIAWFINFVLARCLSPARLFKPLKTLGVFKLWELITSFHSPPEAEVLLVFMEWAGTHA